MTKKDTGEDGSMDAGRMVPLKSGGRITAAMADVLLEILRDLQIAEPAAFEALIDLVNGKPRQLTKEAHQELRDLELIENDGSVHPTVKDVLVSSIQNVPDGDAMLLNPFAFESKAQAATAQEAIDKSHRKGEEWAKRVMDKFRKRHNGQSP